MPASETVDYTRYGYLKISVEPVEEPDSVYFTDQSPAFEVVIKNTTERTVTSPNKGQLLNWVLAVGNGEQIIAEGHIDCTLGPKETYREVIEPGLLAYEDNAVLGVASSSLRGTHQDGADPILINSVNYDDLNKELYTFPVWDRSHYNAVHEQPKRMTKWVMFFGGLTAVLAVIQIALIFARMT